MELGPGDIDADVVADSEITYFEGYLWDPPEAKNAIRLACDIAHKAGRRTAITLSDTFCVDRYRDEFVDLIRSNQVDIVFANAGEARALYQTSDTDTALDMLAQDCALAAVTNGANDAMVITREQRLAVPTFPPSDLKDTTGAGDWFAGGFLYGLTSGRSLETCARIGHFVASAVIEEVGPRPFGDIGQRVEQAGLLA